MTVKPMRLPGTWNRYSTSAMPQDTSAATYHGLWFSSLRCAYQAKVMNTLDSTSRPVACQKALRHAVTPPQPDPRSTLTAMTFARGKKLKSVAHAIV